jgi:flagellar basal body-associated protein FliL
MNKWTIIVLVIILVPIVIAGTFAVLGAKNIKPEEGGAPSPSGEANTTAELGSVTHYDALVAHAPAQHHGADAFAGLAVRTI